MNGFVKIHRQLIEWEWYSDMKVKSVFLHLLLTANFKDTNWKGQGINRGQVIIGKESLGKTLGLSIQEIKTVFKKLKKTGEISTKATPKFIIVTICNFECYQDKEPIKKEVATSKQPPSNPIATSKQPQRKNDKKEKKERKKKKKKKKEHLLDLDLKEDKKTLVPPSVSNFTIDSARELIYEKFGGIEKAVENVAIEYKKQTGFAVDDMTIQTSIASFLQKGMVEYYQNLTRPEQVIAKLMGWITNQIKHQSVNGYNKQQKDNGKLDYEKYYLENLKAIRKGDYVKTLEHITKYGILKKQLADFNSKVDSLQVIREKYFADEKYKNVSIYLIYDLMHTKFKTTLTIGKEEHRMKSLARFVDDLSDFNQTQGKLKVLLDKAYDKQHS
jgi:hypothetical protein